MGSRGISEALEGQSLVMSVQKISGFSSHSYLLIQAPTRHRHLVISSLYQSVMSFVSFNLVASSSSAPNVLTCNRERHQYTLVAKACRFISNPSYAA